MGCLHTFVGDNRHHSICTLYKEADGIVTFDWKRVKLEKTN